MNSRCRRCFGLRSTTGVAVAAILFVVTASQTLSGQIRRVNPRKRLSPGGKTTVSLLLITTDATSAFRARVWREPLQKLGVSFRIRRATSADKIEVRERKMGTFRRITIIGRIDRMGRLRFADRTITRKNIAKLREWIRELKTYGKQGQPRGKPLWGLTKAQFGVIYSNLSKAATKNLHDLPLVKAISDLGLPRKYPVRFSVAAKEAVRGKTLTVRKKIKGISLGTAFALVLRDHSLGFRPLRTPTGSIELVVDPLSEAKDAWPIGWDLQKSRPKTAPKFFKLIPVSLDKVKLVDVLHAVSVKTGVPIYLDHPAIKAKGITVDKLVVSYPSRKASWSLLLRGITVRHRLKHKLRIDEAGNPFVWITTFASGRRRD